MDLLNAVLFWLCLWVLFLNAYFLLFNRGIPNIRTAPAIRRRMVELLREDCRRRSLDPYTIIDLGSGNGSLTRYIAKHMPEARVIGIEISSLAILRSNIMKRLGKTENLSYEKSDFFASDLSRADAVVFYLLGSIMGKIRNKLDQDLKDGTLVLSNRFEIGGSWIPEAQAEIPSLYFHQKKLFVYKKRSFQT